MNWLTGGRKAQLMQTIIQMQYMHQMLKSAQIMQTCETDCGKISEQDVLKKSTIRCYRINKNSMPASTTCTIYKCVQTIEQNNSC